MRKTNDETVQHHLADNNIWGNQFNYYGSANQRSQSGMAIAIAILAIVISWYSINLEASPVWIGGLWGACFVLLTIKPCIFNVSETLISITPQSFTAKLGVPKTYALNDLESIEMKPNMFRLGYQVTINLKNAKSIKLYVNKKNYSLKKQADNVQMLFQMYGVRT